jgi:hypothetical protein
MDLEATRIERPAEAANDTALAGGIPTFKHDQGLAPNGQGKPAV